MGDEKLVSAEKARGCGDGGCVFRAPSTKGQHTNAGCRCLPLRMTPAERVVLREQIRSLVVELDEARAALSGVGVEQYLAARDAATRERERANKAERERDEARAERDRLARILAVERGDESQAPAGWSRPGGRWVGAGGVSVMRGDAPGGGQAWTSFGWDSRHLGWYPCALEAMEAADAAREVTRG